MASLADEGRVVDKPFALLSTEGVLLRKRQGGEYGWASGVSTRSIGLQDTFQRTGSASEWAGRTTARLFGSTAGSSRRAHIVQAISSPGIKIWGTS